MHALGLLQTFLLHFVKAHNSVLIIVRKLQGRMVMIRSELIVSFVAFLRKELLRSAKHAQDNYSIFLLG